MHAHRKKILFPPISLQPSDLQTGFPRRATNTGSLAAMRRTDRDILIHLCSDLRCRRREFLFYVSAQTALAATKQLHLFQKTHVVVILLFTLLVAGQANILQRFYYNAEPVLLLPAQKL